MTIYINDNFHHNKHWTIEINEKKRKITITNGRIGTKGYAREKQFATTEALVKHVQRKIHEKLGKGYRKIPKDEFDRLTLSAQLLGTRNKLDKHHWINLTLISSSRTIRNRHGSLESIDGSHYIATWDTVEDTQIANPNYSPALLIYFVTPHSHNVIIATENNSYEIANRPIAVDAIGELTYLEVPTHNIKGLMAVEITKNNTYGKPHELYEMSQKIKLALSAIL
jgi:predicted DNA-binding WGR domain protein